MANKPRPRKRTYDLRKVQTVLSLNMGGLADVTVVTGGLTGTSANAYRGVTVKGTWALRDKTVNQGPITVGFAHSDYSVTEIKQALEATLGIDIGDKVAQEQANRLVRQVGVFSGQTLEEVLNDGMPIKTRLNWAIGIGDEIAIFVYNRAGVAITAGLLDFVGDLWVKDTMR